MNNYSVITGVTSVNTGAEKVMCSVAYVPVFLDAYLREFSLSGVNLLHSVSLGKNAALRRRQRNP